MLTLRFAAPLDRAGCALLGPACLARWPPWLPSPGADQEGQGSERSDERRGRLRPQERPLTLRDSHVRHWLRTPARGSYVPPSRLASSTRPASPAGPLPATLVAGGRPLQLGGAGGASSKPSQHPSLAFQRAAHIHAWACRRVDLKVSRIRRRDRPALHQRSTLGAGPGVPTPRGMGRL